MKISNDSTVPVYTISGAEARPLPDWLVRKRKRSLKQDPEFANRVELLQDFEFEEASERKIPLELVCNRLTFFRSKSARQRRWPMGKESNATF